MYHPISRGLPRDNKCHIYVFDGTYTITRKIELIWLQVYIIQPIKSYPAVILK